MSIMRQQERVKRVYYFTKELIASSIAAWKYHRTRMKYLMGKGVPLEQAREITHKEVMRAIQHGADAF